MCSILSINAVESKLHLKMNIQESPDHIEYIRTETDCKSWNNEEMEELNSSLKICCIPLPRRLFLFVKYIAPTLVLLFSFAADIFSGVAVAVRHYRDNHIWWFSLTVIFICAPAVMFIAHAIFQTVRNPEVHLKKKLLWIILYIFSGAGLLLWPLWDEENCTVHLERFHSTGAVADNMHKMLKAFLQSAPQLLLQTYILISSPGQQDVQTMVAEIISIIFSLNSSPL
ncbi:hypothetical protein CEXT_258271 [Caerostris extrusa]|uniref:XK-related protein n=1 Tax=Caerostris extrusa TaxID=172846 RepID=A0AAV4NEM4_CAEEX|nr:hypothetical protein CEXT_258271 [Caerostris extrusa]